MTQPIRYGPEPVADWIIDVCGWQDQTRTLGGALVSQLRLVHDADAWWIGIDAHHPQPTRRAMVGDRSRVSSSSGRRPGLPGHCPPPFWSPTTVERSGAAPRSRAREKFPDPSATVAGAARLVK
ncbi:hypothetical protein AB0F92_39760 [Kitasatospora aureofaciens]|uniref:hypothetical protein n=1 Tax=Kitasatospora aureofaciens TaxID=1894 RepID=UPI0033EFCDC6